MKIFALKPKQSHYGEWSEWTFENDVPFKVCDDCGLGGEFTFNIKTGDFIIEQFITEDLQVGKGFYIGDVTPLLTAKYEELVKIESKFSGASAFKYIIDEPDVNLDYLDEKYQELGLLNINGRCEKVKFKGDLLPCCDSCGVILGGRIEVEVSEHLEDLSFSKDSWSGDDFFSSDGFDVLTGVIIVNEKVKDYLDENGFVGIDFIEVQWF
ncbi:MAG: hypothetical protein COA79_21985 [Planctomycetota bacterium]|nr:MAG: hypothetical protein COA79_21985 [Planctomycetota bacterium]